MTPSPAAAAIRGFFSAPLQPSTWSHLLYMLVAFPLGLLYFIFLVIGISLGFGLALLWVGAPLLLVSVGAWWIFAAFERLLARTLLGLDLPPSPTPWKHGEGFLGKLRAHFSARSTWKDLCFVLLKFPLGMMSSISIVVVGASALALLVGPAFGPWTTGHAARIGLWRIDHAWEAAISLVLGLLVLLLTLNLANWLAALWRVIVRPMLGTRPASAEVTSPAVPDTTVHPPQKGAYH